LLHAQFETIHPFDNGNGRTGRALIHVVLRRRGLAAYYVPPISVVLAAERDRYIRGLTEFRSGEVGSWIEQFAAATTALVGLQRELRRGEPGDATALLERFGDESRRSAIVFLACFLHSDRLTRGSREDRRSKSRPSWKRQAGAILFFETCLSFRTE